MSVPLSRRRAIQTIAGGIVAARSAGAMAQPASLGEIAAAQGYLFGAAAADVIFSDAAYRDLYLSQVGIVTTDVALKIGSIAMAPRGFPNAAAARSQSSWWNTSR